MTHIESATLQNPLDSTRLKGPRIILAVGNRPRQQQGSEAVADKDRETRERIEEAIRRCAEKGYLLVWVARRA